MAKLSSLGYIDTCRRSETFHSAFYHEINKEIRINRAIGLNIVLLFAILFLCILVKATCAGLNSFFLVLNMAQSFSTTWKTFGKKAASKLRAREFFFCFVVEFFNSTMSNSDCFSLLKDTAQFLHMTWRESLNFYAWIYMSNFHPVKLK